MMKVWVHWYRKTFLYFLIWSNIHFFNINFSTVYRRLFFETFLSWRIQSIYAFYCRISLFRGSIIRFPRMFCRQHSRHGKSFFLSEEYFRQNPCRGRSSSLLASFCRQFAFRGIILYFSRMFCRQSPAHGSIFLFYAFYYRQSLLFHIGWNRLADCILFDLFEFFLNANFLSMKKYSIWLNFYR